MKRQFGSKTYRWSRGVRLLMTAAIGTQMGIAQAQAQVVVEGPEEPRYVLSYVLLFLMIGLAIFGICRPSRRSRDVK